MKIKDQELLRQIVSDLGLDTPFVKGRKIPVRNCWHFCTDGNAIDVLFYGEADFVDGMNRIYVTLQAYQVIILAFSLMDTHVHFILYGQLDECNRFMHDYVRRTSWYISVKHGERHKLEPVPIRHQVIDNDFYLKVVICYTVKNAPVGGLPYNALDYPWSSGPLYFKRPGLWCSPRWTEEPEPFPDPGVTQRRNILKTRKYADVALPMTGKVVFPGHYVAYELVERIFRTTKSFNYFMCITKEEDVDAQGGTIALLSIPMQEMRQHKNEVCQELFGTPGIKGLNTQQRLRLARTLRARYNSSSKQVIRLCGLVYDEVKDLL